MNIELFTYSLKLCQCLLQDNPKKWYKSGIKVVKSNYIEAGAGIQSLIPERVFSVRMTPSGPCEVLSGEPISRVILHSITGEIMKDISQSGIPTIDVSNLNSGVYIISLFNENEYLGSKRLVKE